MIKKIILILILLNIVGCTQDEEVSEELAKCIGSRSVLYVSSDCLVCDRQKYMFGENIKYLNITDCVEETEKCVINKITEIPTWFIDDEEIRGLQSIRRLKKLTKC